MRPLPPADVLGMVDSDLPAFGLPPTPSNEAERLAALYSASLRRDGSYESLNHIVALAADVFEVPFSLVSIVDDKEQWFPSRCGVDVEATPREVSFCAHAIADHEEMMVVPSTVHDARFKNNPFVLDEPKIRFYAGAILRGPDQLPMGTLCILDRVSRPGFPESHRARLKRLATVVEHLLFKSDFETRE